MRASSVEVSPPGGTQVTSITWESVSSMNLVAARAVSVIPACAQIVLALAIILSTSALVKEGSVPLSFLTMCIWSTTFWGVMLRTLSCSSTGPVTLQALTLIM
jgi:hypothetical protein